MALINLFKVTKTLTDLLTLNITQLIDSSLVGLLDVTAIPPEKVENPQNTLSLHLYHVAEDPYRSEERRVGKEGRSRWSPCH